LKSESMRNLSKLWKKSFD